MISVAPREKRLVSWLAPWIPAGAEVLDVGAGSGLVAEALADRLGARMTLVDVVNYNRSRFRMHSYDGDTLPFGDRSFDAVLLGFTLHHAGKPRRTLQEACRVARDRVIILEDTYRSGVERLVMRWTDWVLNRGHGVSPAWGQWRPKEWRAFVEVEPVRVVHAEEFPPVWLGRYRDPIRHLLLVAEVGSS